ncbi:MAG: hypothetical protein JNM89_00885 [Hyphomicrobiaceae bacterium]|nr:hypothetical protein [Hyphomicrobiaceae bacterium]
MTSYTEQATSEVAEINERLEETDDPREGYRMVLERIAERRARGERIPVDLERLERVLFAECNAESQGR